MTPQKILVPLGGIALLALAFYRYGWLGLAAVAGGIVMFLLLHFNRTMQALKRAADRPIGYVASAVMLNAKLAPGRTLLHAIALTRALGEPRSPAGQQPEVYRWTDTGGSYVEAVFVEGKLREWQLVRPAPTDDGGMAPPPATVA